MACIAQFSCGLSTLGPLFDCQTQILLQSTAFRPPSRLVHTACFAQSVTAHTFCSHECMPPFLDGPRFRHLCVVLQLCLACLSWMKCMTWIHYRSSLLLSIIKCAKIVNLPLHIYIASFCKASTDTADRPCRDAPYSIQISNNTHTNRTRGLSFRLPTWDQGIFSFRLPDASPGPMIWVRNEVHCMMLSQHYINFAGLMFQVYWNSPFAWGSLTPN